LLRRNVERGVARRSANRSQPNAPRQERRVTSPAGDMNDLA
jgi:hypothetical protein